MSERLYKTITREIDVDINDEIKIWMFGDVHRFTKSCDEERWKSFLVNAKKTNDKNTYYLGLGDYTDFASTSEMKALQREMHLQTMVDLDEYVMKRNRALASEMMFMSPRIIGLIDGNHGWTFQNGKRATEDLAERLKTDYLGWLAHITLKCNVWRSGYHTTIQMYIVACHGKAGGGKTAGLTINQVDDLRNIFPVADIYCVGHDHQRAARPISVLIPYNKHNSEVEIKQKRQLLCRTGSFKKAYMDGEASYEVGRLLRPADLGPMKVTISFKRVQSRQLKLDTTVPEIRAEL